MAQLIGKLAVVTGASAGIGKEIAWGLYKLGADVVIPVRNVPKGNSVREELIERATKQGLKDVGTLTVAELDLSKQKSIAKFVSDFKAAHKKLHILVNNAAQGHSGSLTKTEDGLELSFATNVMGYVLLTRGLLGLLEADGTPARVVNLASTYAGGFDIDDLNFDKRGFNPDLIYRASKAANRMLSWAQDKKLRAKGSAVTVNACSPGFIDTALIDSFGLKGVNTPEQGAITPLHLATEPSLEKVSGTFWDDLKEIPCEYKQNEELNERLWQICESFTKVQL